jgi:hypothetical protein
LPVQRIEVLDGLAVGDVCVVVICHGPRFFYCFVRECASCLDVSIVCQILSDQLVDKFGLVRGDLVG